MNKHQVTGERTVARVYRQAHDGSAMCECGRDYFFHKGLECPQADADKAPRETSSQFARKNDPNKNYAMYEADREAKRKAQPSLPAVTGERIPAREPSGQPPVTVGQLVDAGIFKPYTDADKAPRELWDDLDRLSDKEINALFDQVNPVKSEHHAQYPKVRREMIRRGFITPA